MCDCKQFGVFSTDALRSPKGANYTGSTNGTQKSFTLSSYKCGVFFRAARARALFASNGNILWLAVSEALKTYSRTFLSLMALNTRNSQGALHDFSSSLSLPSILLGRFVTHCPKRDTTA